MSEKCWTRIARKINNCRIEPSFKANNITLKNRFSVLDTKVSNGKERSCESKKINKRKTEYIPTFMYSMKENSKVKRKSTVSKPTDINVYEISVMEKIKDNVKFNKNLKRNVEDHIQTLKQRFTTVSSHANPQDDLQIMTTTDIPKNQFLGSDSGISVGGKKSNNTSSDLNIADIGIDEPVVADESCVQRCLSLRQYLKSKRYKLCNGTPIEYNLLSSINDVKKDCTDIESYEKFIPDIEEHISRIEQLTSDSSGTLKLRGGAQTPKKKDHPKEFSSTFEELNTALNVLRSSTSILCLKNHRKCRIGEFCDFCLLRSLIIKINSPKGRQRIIPVEVECHLERTDYPIFYIGFLYEVLRKAFSANMEYEKEMCFVLRCNSCNEEITKDDDFALNLESDAENRNVKHLLEVTIKKMWKYHILCCKNIKDSKVADFEMSKEQNRY